MAGGLRGPYDMVFSFLEDEPKHIVVWFFPQSQAKTFGSASIYQEKSQQITLE
jgi:hypothetical protein